MTPEQLKAGAIEIWGERGFVAALSSALGVDRTQVWRYLNGHSRVPGPVAAAMKCWLESYRSSGKKP